MKNIRQISVSSIFMLIFLNIFTVCNRDKGVINTSENKEYSGTYCINEQNIEIVINQSGNNVTFTIMSGVEITGTGAITGRTMTLTGNTTDKATFTAILVFTNTGQSFSGTYRVTDASGIVSGEEMLEGTKGRCAVYDIGVNGIPKLTGKDFTQLNKIHRISRFRSGIGHSYTDRFETCRSMKHYYSTLESFRKNNTIEIYSPVAGIIASVSNDGHGTSIGLNNKQIRIRPDNQPAFIFRIFHTDLVSSNIAKGKKVQAGELIGYARLFYEDLAEYADSFDIAVEVNTPSGIKLVSYFETMEDAVFNTYIARGAFSRQDFIITREARDSDPLKCNGETFITSGTINNWVILN